MNTSSARAASKTTECFINCESIMQLHNTSTVTLCSSFSPVCCIFCNCVKLAVLH